MTLTCSLWSIASSEKRKEAVRREKGKKGGNRNNQQVTGKSKTQTGKRESAFEWKITKRVRRLMMEGEKLTDEEEWRIHHEFNLLEALRSHWQAGACINYSYSEAWAECFNFLFVLILNFRLRCETRSNDQKYPAFKIQDQDQDRWRRVQKKM